MHYFVSDVHLGADCDKTDLVTVEDRFVKWLNKIAPTAESLFLGGDIFDFWFEYKRVVPMGFTSVLAKLKEMSRGGVRVVMMVGNHDMWMGDYLTRECGVEIYYRPTHFEVAGKMVHIAHGDNLNVKGDFKLKLMNTIFRSESIRIAFKWLVHPDLAIAFGKWWSGNSRKKHCNNDGRGVKHLIEYAQQRQKQIRSDYYLYGHLHEVLDHQEDGYRVIFVNDWSSEPHCVAIDNNGEARIEKI